MKWCINYFVAILVFIQKIQAFPADLNEDTNCPFPQENESIRWMTGSKNYIEPTLMESPAYLSSNIPDRIHFHLYTQENLNEPVDIDMNDVESLIRSPYDFRNPTAFVIHGWKDGISDGVSIGLKSALFQEGQNRKLNFISVNWSIYSQFENYTISQQLCSTAGKVVGQFIDWMHENAKLQFDTLTLYGSSMGAHVAGFAGKNVQRGKIHSIVAMDPALPEFPYNNPKARLADTDAQYVESIHTNGGCWGFYQPIGQTAFYPNGGKIQPGCESGICSHFKAVLYLVEALSYPEKNQFHAVKCDQLEHVGERKCDQYESMIQMGDPSNVHKPRGIYYLQTNSESPYGKGYHDFIEKKQIQKN